MYDFEPEDENDVEYFLEIKHIVQHYKHIINEMPDKFKSTRDALDKIQADVYEEILQSGVKKS